MRVSKRQCLRGLIGLLESETDAASAVHLESRSDRNNAHKQPGTNVLLPDKRRLGHLYLVIHYGVTSPAVEHTQKAPVK